MESMTTSSTATPCSRAGAAHGVCRRIERALLAAARACRVPDEGPPIAPQRLGVVIAARSRDERRSERRGRRARVLPAAAGLDDNNAQHVRAVKPIVHAQASVVRRAGDEARRLERRSCAPPAAASNLSARAAIVCGGGWCGRRALRVRAPFHVEGPSGLRGFVAIEPAERAAILARRLILHRLFLRLFRLRRWPPRSSPAKHVLHRRRWFGAAERAKSVDQM